MHKNHMIRKSPKVEPADEEKVEGADQVDETKQEEPPKKKKGSTFCVIRQDGSVFRTYEGEDAEANAEEQAKKRGFTVVSK